MKVLAAIEYYKIQRIGVGQGANSEVFIADEPQLGGQVVVKEIPKNSFRNPADYYAEAQAMFASATKNVVPVHYACETSSHICLVMPYFPKGSLSDRISSGPLPPVEAIRVFLAVLGGLAEIHVKRLLHFDIKPSNILFTNRDEPLVADFGQSSRIGASGIAFQPRIYCFMMPPESIGTFQGSVESDIYQCGLSLYRAVNGDAFFEAQKPSRNQLAQEILDGRFPDRSSFQPHVPKRLRTVIRKALMADPADRYSSASDFIDALGQVECQHNWEMSSGSAGNVTWRSTRKGKATVFVDLSPAGSRWKVEVHTGETKKRKLRENDLWRQGLTRKQADAHLKAVFEDLCR